MEEGGGTRERRLIEYREPFGGEITRNGIDSEDEWNPVRSDESGREKGGNKS